MTIDTNVVLLEQFGAGLMIGCFVRAALQRPLVSAAVLIAAMGIFVACLNDPNCREAKCFLDSAVIDLADAIAWWISKPAFALGCALGFAIVARLRKPPPA